MGRKNSTELLEVLRVQGATVRLKINGKKTKRRNRKEERNEDNTSHWKILRNNYGKKTKSPRLGISEDEKVTLGNEKIDQVGSFTYLGFIIGKDGGSSDDIKSRIARAHGLFSKLKKRLEE